LSIVLEDYFTDRTDHLRTGKFARYAGKLFLEAWGPLVKVSALTEARQREFVEACLAKGFAIGYVTRIMVVLAAAVHRAKLPIDIVTNEGEMLARWPIKPKPARKAFIPTDKELARFLGAPMPENLRRWALMAMGTGGRPEAVLDLSPEARRRDAGLIDLLPTGRRQNKKYRPTVRVGRVLRLFLDRWEAQGLDGFGGRYCGYAGVDSIDTALHRVRRTEAVNLPYLSVYSFRHAAATAIRAAKVPEEQLEYQLGHRRPSSRVTRMYGKFDPDYLLEASRALDAWALRVIRMAQKGRENPHSKRQKAA